MVKAWFKKYGGLLILGVSLIIIYQLASELIWIGAALNKIIDVLKPFFIGAVLAYILYIPAGALEKRWRKSPHAFLRKHARGCSIFLCYITMIVVVTGTVIYLFPIIRSNLAEMSARLPAYTEQLQGYLYDFSIEINQPELYDTVLNKITTVMDSLFQNGLGDADELINQGVGMVNIVFDVIMALVICPYLLFDRNRLVNLLDRILSLKISQEDISRIHEYFRRVNHIFASFLYGKAIDSLIIGIIAYIGFRLMRIKFDLLMALVIMVTNMIPYFGPFIGGIPVTILTALTTGLQSGFWVGVFIICLQQFDGLILGPYILGESVGVSALWIIFAITFFGGTMGFIGMIIGVPLIAVIRMTFNDYYEYKMASKKIEQ